MNSRNEVKFEILLASCVLLLVSFSAAAQQNQPSSARLLGIPISLHSSLIEGIQQFVEAQRQGDWSQLAVLLGPFRNTSYGKRYTNKHKQCLIEQMKSAPMLSFVPTDVSFSSEILGRPLSRRWWNIGGIAEFTEDGLIVRRGTTITAYRFGGRWFFSPPNYDDKWEATKITDGDLAADLSSYLKVQVAPDCPLELLRLSVRMDPKDRSLRRVSFDLRNNSRKEVDALNYVRRRSGRRE